MDLNFKDRLMLVQDLFKGQIEISLQVDADFF